MSQNTAHTVDKISWKAYAVCGLAALFYLYEFILQVSPSVMTHELMQDLGINAAKLGVVAAFYYYAYTLMQFPAGLLYDRFGPRRLITIAVLICAVGALLFSVTHSVALASVGRMLMGIGSAFAFIGSLVLLAHWFPLRYFALLAGMVQLMSSIGAICGQAPLAAAISAVGWRFSFGVLTVLGVLLAAAVWLVVRDRPAGQANPAAHRETLTHFFHSLKMIGGQAQTWYLAIYSFTSWAPITAFAALWGVPYLASLYGVSPLKASTACSMIWVGVGIGSPLIGWWSDHIGRRIMPLAISSLLGLIASIAIIYMPHISWGMIWFLLLLLGLAASGQSLSFGLVRDNNPDDVVGAAIGFNNMAVVLTGAALQPLIGYLMQLKWDGTVLNGTPIYSVASYQVGMAIIPISFLVGLLVAMFWLRETNCQPSYKKHS